MNKKLKMEKGLMPKRLILLGILVLFFIIGCKGGEKKSPITDIDIRKGTDGMLMEFLPNAPPENVFEETGFPISLKLKNAGASNINDGKLALGFERAYVGMEWNVDVCTQDKVEECGDGSKVTVGKCVDSILKETGDLCRVNIKGKSIYNPFGDEDFITINAEAKKIGVQSEIHPSTIFATACYPYNTSLGASVCIDPDIIGQEKGQKACQAKDLVFSNGQGGPVAITKVETRILPQDNNKVKPHFLIHVKNIGNGEIVNVSNFEKACTSEKLDYKGFFNSIIVSASLSGIPLICNGEKVGNDPTRVIAILRKESDSAFAKSEDLIRCTLEEMEITKEDGTKQRTELINSGVNAYVAPLKVVLEYGYTFTISKDIIIEKVLTH